MKSIKRLVIYHGNCVDGFAAAWVLRKHYDELDVLDTVEFHPGIYQTSPPDVTDKEVYMVDFSYKRAIIEEILTKCRSLTIIDHHKSAITDLESLIHEKLDTYFDVTHSGSMLTWQYCFSQTEPPDLLKIIEHRDLWKFSDPPTDYDVKVRQIQADLFSYPYDFDVWDALMGETDLGQLALQGEAIERKHFKDIRELISVGQQRAIIAGFDVPVVNVPYTLSSDAGHILGEGEPFAACWMDTKEGRVFSLRSSKNGGIDVSEIAKHYGGGGHKNAAGFKIPYAQLDIISFIRKGQG